MTAKRIRLATIPQQGFAGKSLQSELRIFNGNPLYIMNAFMEPLCGANGWSRGQINPGMGLAALAGQIAMPVVAGLSTRFSLRVLMILGALTGGTAAFYSAVSVFPSWGSRTT